MMRIRLGLLFAVLACLETASAGTDWRSATPGAVYGFPADHSFHPDFKTEWWYFTGTLKTNTAKEYGYELTFFRQGVLPPSLQKLRSDLAPEARSKFVQNDFKFAHFAITELTGQQFHFTQKINRGTFDDAGFGALRGQGSKPGDAPAERLAWIEDWSLTPQPDGSWRLTAQGREPTPMAIDLVVRSAKAPVIEGATGVSQKALGNGNASCYYSYTRLETTGTLAVGSDASQPVTGESWFDHEWASNQLAADQIGWNWFCFQFDDQTELMVYAMRRRDGSVDPVSSGTLVAADGRVEYLRSSDFTLRPLRSWHSRLTGATYPVAWQVEIPSRQLTLEAESRLDEQELVLPPISYWEGAIRVTGRRGDRPIEGHGYMELTGYAGALKGLQEH